MKPTLLHFFLLIVALELIGEATEALWLVYSCKPLIMLTLIGWLAAKQDLKSNFILFLGTIFALLGDVFLMMRGINLFIFGLGSFLLMQICYIIHFSKNYSFQWKSIIPFIIYGLGFLAILYKPITQNPTNQTLLIPIVFYSITLCSMGVMAAMRKKVVSETSYVWVLAGAILFILSDSTIAFNRFVQPFVGASFLIMSTYAAAQWLIVRGLFKE